MANFVQWNYGVSGNRAQARSLIAAIKDSGFNYGIYSSPGVSYPVFYSATEQKTNILKKIGMECNFRVD